MRREESCFGAWGVKLLKRGLHREFYWVGPKYTVSGHPDPWGNTCELGSGWFIVQWRLGVKGLCGE